MRREWIHSLARYAGIGPGAGVAADPQVGHTWVERQYERVSMLISWVSVEKYSVPALARAFEILDMLAMSSVGLTKMDIARSVGIPYSTAFNLLNTMQQHGYVRREATGKYYLGLKLLSLGCVPVKDIGLRDTAAPVLEELVRRSELTAHLAILDRGEAI